MLSNNGRRRRGKESSAELTDGRSGNGHGRISSIGDRVRVRSHVPPVGRAVIVVVVVVVITVIDITVIAFTVIIVGVNRKRSGDFG